MKKQFYSGIELDQIFELLHLIEVENFVLHAFLTPGLLQDEEEWPIMGKQNWKNPIFKEKEQSFEDRPVCESCNSSEHVKFYGFVPGQNFLKWFCKACHFRFQTPMKECKSRISSNS